MTVLAVDAAPNPWFSPSWVVDNWGTIMPLLVQHVRLTVVSVLIGAVIAFPLALLARRSRYLTGPVLGVSTLVYTVPSLAMFAFLAPFTGLSETTVAVGLVLYSLVILVRNFLAGLQAVPADAVEAARGMGYGPGRLLLKVEIPLALPSIMAGLRIATVSTVALVTVGVVVGQGGLGQIIIVNGFSANYYRPPIVFGTLACVLLALVADQLLAVLERVLTPWTRTPTRAVTSSTTRTTRTVGVAA
ncbi:MAG: transporter permease [Klenkia sp.]|nr:transporter permease [Klenkia sp.]